MAGGLAQHYCKYRELCCLHALFDASLCQAYNFSQQSVKLGLDTYMLECRHYLAWSCCDVQHASAELTYH